MAIDKKDTKPTISAASSGITSAANPTAAQTIAKVQASSSPLKGSTDVRLKAEAGLLAPLNGSAVSNASKKPTEEELKLQRYIQAELYANKYDLTDPLDNDFALTYQRLANKTSVTQGEIFAADTSDKRVAKTQVGESINEDGSRTYYVGSGLTQYLASHSSIQASGVQPQNSGKDRFKLTSIGDVQREMFDAVEIAAKKTGVPAKLLGAMAGKETRFGQGQVSSSGAEGLFQQTDGYLLANYVITEADLKKNPGKVKMVEAQVKQIASVVPEAAEYMKDGKISLAEARKLAWNPTAAAMLTALRAQALAKDYNLNLNDSSSWAYVYTEHNAGRGSLNKLLKGGMTDKWIQDLNPSMYKGADSAKDVLQIAANDMQKWGDRYEKLVASASDSSSSLASAAITKAQASSKADLRKPAPEPA